MCVGINQSSVTRVWSTPRSSGSNWRAGSNWAEVTPAFWYQILSVEVVFNTETGPHTEKPAPITSAGRRDQGIALDRRGADAFEVQQQPQAESYTDWDLYPQSCKSGAERGIDVQRCLVASKTTSRTLTIEKAKTLRPWVSISLVSTATNQCLQPT